MLDLIVWCLKKRCCLVINFLGKKYLPTALESEESFRKVEGEGEAEVKHLFQELQRRTATEVKSNEFWKKEVREGWNEDMDRRNSSLA